MRFSTVAAVSAVAPLVAAHGGIPGAPKVFGLPRDLNVLLSWLARLVMLLILSVVCSRLVRVGKMDVVVPILEERLARQASAARVLEYVYLYDPPTAATDMILVLRPIG
jgi:hypothetical protein